MEKQIFEIKTTSDLQMNIQIAEETDVSVPAVFNQDVVVFVIHGYNSQADSEVEEFVTIRKNEARRLIKILDLLTHES